MNCSNWNWSIYNCCEIIDGTAVLFNTVSNSLIAVEKEIYQDWLCTGNYGKDEKVLKEAGFIYQQSDEAFLHSKFQERYDSRSSMSFWIYLNMDCNFQCGYCFETGRTNGRYMAKGRAAQIIKWIVSYMDAGLAEIDITFMGGEPLLSGGMLLLIYTALAEAASARKIRMNCCIITNGSLLMENLHIFQQGRFYMQVTLDGLASVHDKRRVFQGGKPTFHVIMRNIIHLLNTYGEHIELTIRINVDEENMQSAKDLIRYLNRLDLSRRVGICLGETITKGRHGRRQADFYGRILHLYQTASDCGFAVCLSEENACCLSSPRWFMIDWNGDLYKCPSIVGMKEFSVGNAASGCNQQYSRQLAIRLWESKNCCKCTYVGICSGGCRYQSYLNTGSLTHAGACRKEYYSMIMPDLIKIRYQEGMRAKGQAALPLNL